MKENDGTESLADNVDPPTPRAAGEHSRVFSSEDIFAGQNEVEIQHQGESYRLRITRNGKLILHK